jgi:hypothetical protein
MVVPMAAAFVMTQWDLVMDPPSSTIARAGYGMMAEDTSAFRS